MTTPVLLNGRVLTDNPHYCALLQFKAKFQKYTLKSVTRVSFLVRQEVWGPPNSLAGPGQSSGKGSRGPTKPSMKLWLYLKLQGYFGYENDRTHVINVVVLVVKITIQLTYGILGFKKKKRDFKVIMLRCFYVIARKTTS